MPRMRSDDDAKALPGSGRLTAKLVAARDQRRETGLELRLPGPDVLTAWRRRRPGRPGAAASVLPWSRRRLGSRPVPERRLASAPRPARCTLRESAVLIPRFLPGRLEDIDLDVAEHGDRLDGPAAIAIRCASALA